MSRLDWMIERLQAQRACIEWAAQRLAGLPGELLELGLGSGRTYDHLRQHFPERDIYVFDLRAAAHSSCVPPTDRLLLGDVRETLPRLGARLAGSVALVHADVGSADHDANRRLAGQLAPLIAPMMRPGGLILSNREELFCANARALPMPPGAAVGHCFMFEVGAR